MADFPAAVTAYSAAPTSGALGATSPTQSELHDLHRGEIIAVETELGPNPAGDYSTVAGRLDALDLPVFDPVAYGAAVDGVTDDTAAVQAAINAAGAAGGGIVRCSKGGVSIIGGALQDTGGANAQITLPQLDAVDDEAITVAIRGPIPPAVDVSVIGATPAPDNHWVLKSTLASGTGAVIGCIGPVGTALNFSNIHVEMSDLSVRTGSNPTLTAIDMRHAATAEIRRVLVDTGAFYVDTLTQPTTATSFGLRMPANNNGARSTLEDVDVVGFYNGFEFAEHTSGDRVNAWGCRVAATFVESNHASVFQRFMAVHCTTVLKWTGVHAVDVWQLNIEHAASGWQATTADISDPSNYGSGFVRWWVVLAGSGPSAAFTKSGGSGLSTSRVGDALGSGGGSLTVQDENGSVSTGVSQIDFQGAGVSASSGSGEVVVTIPGGVATVAELVMQDGVSSPPVPLENEAGTDWLYTD